MPRLGFVSLIAGFVAIPVVVVVMGTASAGKSCARTKFQTVLVRDACQKGGQDEAKVQMKTFLKQAKKKEATLGCASCHSKVGGDYPLKPDGLKRFVEHGGKRI